MNPTRYCTLATRGLIAFEGPDARAFLHGQLTCDVAGLPATASTYGAYCTPKGRVLATFLLWPTGDGLMMQLARALREPVQKRLSMYILRSKVKATDATEAHVQYGVAGAGAAAVAEKTAGAAPQSVGEVVRGEHGTAVRLPRDRYLVVVPAGTDFAAAALAGAQEEPELWWDGLDVDAGIPNVLPETQEQFVPQMLNLDAVGGISFSKGCYPGQEIVARMHYLGRLKERMVAAHVPAPARAGDKVYGADLGSQATGMIVNAVPVGDGHDVLAVVHTSSLAAGPLTLGADGPALALRDLPYALPQK